MYYKQTFYYAQEKYKVCKKAWLFFTNLWGQFQTADFSQLILLKQFNDKPRFYKNAFILPSQSFSLGKPQNDCLAKTLSFQQLDKRYGQTVSLTQEVEDLLTNLSIH